MPDEKRTAQISGDHDYKPWPELRHAAAALRKIAAEYPPGSLHTTTAAVVMMAFSVEAFIQTVGPQVLKDVWTQEQRPAERWPPLKKLKEIGKRVKVPVDYGKSPWKDIGALFEARDALAHAKPLKREASGEIVVPETGEVNPDALRGLLREKYQPLHDLKVLNALAPLIDDALRPIWIAAGNNEYGFTAQGNSAYIISMEDRR